LPVGEDNPQRRKNTSCNIPGGVFVRNFQQFNVSLVVVTAALTMPVPMSMPMMMAVPVVVPMMTAGGIFAQLTPEVPFEGLLHGAFSAGGGLNPEILEVVDCASPHPSRDDHFSAMLIDESRHLSMTVPTDEGV
jgi:hypothetical protein